MVASTSIAQVQVDMQEVKVVPQAGAIESWVSTTETVNLLVPVIVRVVVSA